MCLVWGDRSLIQLRDFRPVGRFAPSPTGALHLGSLLAALASWLSVKSRGGLWLLRIEDLDGARERPGASIEMIRTLAAFGLESDAPVCFQSERSPLYADALAQLDTLGLIYPCSCSRRELEGQAVYPGTCAAGIAVPKRPTALRVRVPDQVLQFDDLLRGQCAQNLKFEVGDFVVRRADGVHAYQLAVVVDDAAQGITEVVRGADLLDSTARQIYLTEKLGLPTLKYAHVPLLLNADGSKLSKSAHALPVDPARPLDALRPLLRLLCGVSVSGADPQALLATAARDFSWARLPSQLSVEELLALN